MKQNSALPLNLLGLFLILLPFLVLIFLNSFDQYIGLFLMLVSIPLGVLGLFVILGNRKSTPADPNKTSFERIVKGIGIGLGLLVLAYFVWGIIYSFVI